MANIEDVEIPSLLFDEQASDPTAPATGFWRAFFKADGLYIVDDAGTITGPLGTGGGGSVSSVSIASRAATQGIGAGNVPIQWDTEERDDDGMIDTVGANPSRFTIPTTGAYLFMGYLEWASNSTGLRTIGLLVNGTDFVAVDNRAAASGTATRITTSMGVDVTAGDYIELFGNHSAGGTLNVTSARLFCARQA